MFHIKNQCNVLFIGSTKSGKTSTFLQMCKEGLVTNGEIGHLIIVAPNATEEKHSITNIANMLNYQSYVYFKNLREFVHKFQKLPINPNITNLLVFDDFQSDLHSLKSNVKQKYIDEYLEDNRSLDNVYSETQIFEKLITENMNHGNFIQIFMLQKYDGKSSILRTLATNTNKFVMFVDQAAGKKVITEPLSNIDTDIIKKLDTIRQMVSNMNCKYKLINFQGRKDWFMSFPVIFDKEDGIKYYIGPFNQIEL